MTAATIADYAFDFTFTGVHHLQLAIPPGGEGLSRVFWGELLGMTELEKPVQLGSLDGCWFRGGQLEVRLVVENDFRPFRKAHPAILVRSLGDLARRLEDKGHPVTWEDGLPGFDRFHTFDKVGNRLEFLEGCGPS
ncbi:glyoxalase [Streptomyces orinoci]|uniref:Glyoxalase n=1 Tax=Streptomyces orinoci TaxID=67339 RepID=A0ABV3JZE0_STRON|nr:glyoxalase [Streptomyces orinoci]